MRGTVAGAALATLCASGCASEALQGYVGKPVDAVARAYGPPVDQQLLPNGLTAFRWVIASGHRPGADKPLDTFLPVADAPLKRRLSASRAGLLMGGMCVYIVLAGWKPATNQWRVVGYRTPRIDCN